MKIISGLSTNDSITFSSQKAKITVDENGKCSFISFVPSGEEKNIEYEKNKEKNDNELNEIARQCMSKNIFIKFFSKIKFFLYKKKFNHEKKKTKLLHKLTKVEIFFIIFEILVSVISKLYFNKYFIFAVACLGLAVSIFFIANAVISFMRDEKLRSKHGAEHMVYNSYTKDDNLKIENIKKKSTYCKHCGSVKPSNFFFLEFLNVILAYFTGVYIPHVLIAFICINYCNALLLNFFAPIYQKFLTKEPSDKDLKLAQMTLLILINIDSFLSLDMEVSPPLLQVIILTAKEQMNELNKS